MYRIDEIMEEGEDILIYLRSRQIIDAYKKAKSMIKNGYAQKYDFKKRQPKNDGIYQFRINQKYRAFGKIRNENDIHILVVYLISDHQDF